MSSLARVLAAVVVSGFVFAGDRANAYQVIIEGGDIDADVVSPTPADARTVPNEGLEPGPAVTVEVTIVEVEGVGPTPAAELIGGATADAAGIVERIKQSVADGRPAAVTRVRLATLDQQRASVQQGGDSAVVNGETIIANNQRQPIYERDQFGTIVSVTPRVDREGDVVMELTVERSQFGRAETREDGGAVPQSKETFQAKVTLRVPDGETVVAHASETPGDEAAVLRAILVTARTGTEGLDDGEVEAEETP